MITCAPVLSQTLKDQNRAHQSACDILNGSLRLV